MLNVSAVQLFVKVCVAANNLMEASGIKVLAILHTIMPVMFLRK